MMDGSPFTAMAQQLQAQAEHGAVVSSNKCEGIRVLLEEFGALPARALAKHLDLPSGRIGALAKHDITRGRITFSDGLYRLTPGWDERESRRLQQAAQLLRRYGYSVEAPQP
jgi:hypothetical protein